MARVRSMRHGTRSVRVICRCASAEDHNFAIVYNFSFSFFLGQGHNTTR